MASAVDVDLWVWPLDVAEGERERLATHLSEDERARAARFAFARDRQRYTVARGRLREILAARLSCGAAALGFDYSENEKPTLRGGQACQFNLSHSEGMAALAICDGFELGVDIEHVRPLKEDIAGRYFSRREVDALRRLPDGEQLDGFFRCWTRKEAIVKAIGEGLTRPLDSFDVSVSLPAVVERIVGDDAREWRLAHFEPAAGYVGAIACRTGGGELKVMRRIAT